MFGWLKSMFGGSKREQPLSPALRAAMGAIQARYDAAQTTDENARRWRMTDVLSAKAANSFNVRRTLKQRSRYVIANNSYAQGIVGNKVTDLIGTGPTPQVTLGGRRPLAPRKNKRSDPNAGRIEDSYGDWWEAVGGLEKLTTACRAKIGDGEGFLILASYDAVPHSVKLYPRDIESDQVTTPQPLALDELFTDGMRLDRMGNPVSYDVLRSHPGDFLYPNLDPLAVQQIKAANVLHWFRRDRPGQVRGIPELTPALELFEQMRGFRMATLTAAEIAALFTAILKSNGPPNTEEPLTPMTTANLERGMLTNLPAGWDLTQLAAQHPSTTYEVFVYCLLAEACRCINVPLNIALGTSQKFNFSSARLDHINYRDALRVERRQCEQRVLTPLFRAWLEEAVMVPGLLPSGLSSELVRVTWHWPGWSYMDPLKDAQADGERLGNRTLTFAQFYAEQGKDWEEEFEQLAAEKDRMDELGLTPEDVAPPAADAPKPDEAKPPPPKKKKAGKVKAALAQARAEIELLKCRAEPTPAVVNFSAPQAPVPKSVEKRLRRDPDGTQVVVETPIYEDAAP